MCKYYNNMISSYDREGLRKVLREIDLKSHKASEGMRSLYEGSEEKVGIYSEDKILDAIQYLRSDSGRYGKTRMDVMLEHQKGSYDVKNKMNGLSTREMLHEQFMKEKMMENREDESIKYSDIHGINGDTPVKPSQRSLNDIKAEFINEMNKLTQKYQEEINNLR